ncbi:hypothetical protein ACQKIC_05925 [Peribacillus sp. NPDC046944]|uniref:hypothetical protein n=1 Tax=unclassified Peribacillus TaxID=2675266 RepID=UPI003CFFB116
MNEYPTIETDSIENADTGSLKYVHYIGSKEQLHEIRGIFFNRLGEEEKEDDMALMKI